MGAVLEASWKAPGRPLGASCSLLGLSQELLSPSRGLLEPSWGHLVALFGVLRRESVNSPKNYNTSGTSTFLRSRRVQDAAKLGQVRRKKGPSWHLEAILEPRRPKMAKMALKMRVESAKMPLWRRLGRLLGGPGEV